MEATVENPVLTECRRADGGGSYWRLDVDVRLLNEKRGVYLMLRGVRIARGRVSSPLIAQMRGPAKAVCELSPDVERAIVDACRLVGWREAYPTVVWPV